jgi:hypothetical protein
MDKRRGNHANQKLSKSAEEYSIHSVSLDGDEFGIVGASHTINTSSAQSANKSLYFKESLGATKSDSPPVQ